MSHDRDVRRLLDAWFAEGPVQVADRVIDGAAGRISRQPQRAAWRLQGRFTVTTQLKLVAALAAALVVAVVGWQLLPGNGGFGSSPTATPAATVTTNPLPSLAATEVPALPEGTLEGGTYRLHPFASRPGLSIDLTVPGGWQGTGFGVLAPGGTGAPSGIGIAVMRPDGVFADGCRWDQAKTGDWEQPGVAVGPTVDDLVGALRANASYTSSDPVPVTIGGYAGQRVDLQLPSDLDFATCDIVTGQPAGNFFVFTGSDAGLYVQGSANLWHVSIIDVGGIRVVVVVDDYAGTSAADRNAAQAILDSFAITP